jgi:hypothetical protein
MNISYGDYVRTKRHGHTGRAYTFERLTEANADWIRNLTIQPSLEEILGTWVGILCNGGGAVLTPMSQCEKIPPIEGFNHPYAQDHFK